MSSSTDFKDLLRTRHTDRFANEKRTRELREKAKEWSYLNKKKIEKVNRKKIKSENSRTLGNLSFLLIMTMGPKPDCLITLPGHSLA